MRCVGSSLPMRHLHCFEFAAIRLMKTDRRFGVCAIVRKAWFYSPMMCWH
jgi:hypothetical protein